MAIRWNLTRLTRSLKRNGIQNPSQFAAFAGLTKPTAAKVLAGGRLEKIDVATLEAVCRAFDLTPGSALELTDDGAS